METTSKPDTTNVKVESSTNNENHEQEQGRPNFGPNRRGHGRGGHGGRFGRGGGGPFHRGDRDMNHRNDGDFKMRRGGRGGGGRGGGPMGPGRQDESQEDDRPQEHRPPRGPIDRVQEKLQLLGGPTFDLPPINMSEKKFNGRNRLYIGNIGGEVTEQDLTDLFKPYGETSEIFINKDKNFAFIKVDYHSNAEKGKRELDGTIMKGRNLKIRFAPNSATIKVRNLTQMVTNELLHYAFSPFGEIERALVCVDERGKPTGEGVIDFARKGSALAAMRKCNEGCYFLTNTLQPVIVEVNEIVDDNDGYSDKNINKKNHDFSKERECGPRFATPGSFEHDYGMRWKAIYELHQQKQEALKKELQLEKDKLEAQMEYAKYEHETEVLREQLRSREMDKERQKREWEMKQRQAEEERQRAEEQMRRAQEEVEARMVAQQEDMRRRQQENSLFMQAHNLDNMLDQQEQAYDPNKFQPNQFPVGGGPDMDPKQFMSSYERHNRYDGRDQGGPRSGQNMGGRGHWVSDNRRDDFPNKRRRF